MRRVIAIVAALAAVGVALVLVLGSSRGSSSGPDYWVELDNGFGLIQGGDVKIAGVRAGKISKLELDRRTNLARVGIDVTATGFGSIRSDVTCSSRPQSLIGEYFVDCLPGTSKRVLPRGATIGVEHTESTVGPDLVNDILRRPQRERLSIILGELGAGVAGNGANLNAAIRRAAPALRETDKVLASLATQNRVLADLTVNADRVIGDLAGNRRDVGRFVTTARRTAVASAERRTDIAAGIRRFPAFLQQLTPTMAALGRTADAQAPALRDLRNSAPQLTALFRNLTAFSKVSLPAFRELAKASVTGRKAVVTATPVVEQLQRFSGGTPELAKNLAIVLEHLSSTDNYVEEDARAAQATGRPMPTGYTGLEALLSYVYDQTQSTNIFDQNSHILKISAIPPTDPCADYADAKKVKADPKLLTECSTALGPNQPGINFTDPTAPPASSRGASSRLEIAPIVDYLLGKDPK